LSIQAGQKLLHYRLIEKIGEGGMGVVWKAEDTKLHRNVALKVLPEAMAVDPDRRARFEREARAVAGLNHPNIVTLHSVEEAPSAGSGQGESIHFITMELIEGQSLTELLPRNGFSLNRLLEIAIPLAEAVSTAHRAGITHRDLKPDNIMFDSEGRLRVLDFGLAKRHDRSDQPEESQIVTATSDTAEGRILGTVAYMSPEQAEGKSVDPRSDVFSLGTILYEMVTGGRPFQGDTSISTISAILKDEPGTITDLKPSLPVHLGRIIRRCLMKDPGRRYETAVGLRNELEELKSELDSGEHKGAPARPGRISRKSIALGVFGMIAIVSIIAITQWNRSVPEPASYAPRPMTSAIEWESDVSWSPESDFIAFGRMGDSGLDVMVQPVAGGSAEVRAGGPGDETTPRWSPDGKLLAYISSSEPGSFIYLVPPHGGEPRKLIATNIPTLDVEKASSSMGDRPWSLDSKSLLVSRAGETARAAIYRVDCETGDAKQISFPPAGSLDLSPTYSFDGKRIVFLRRNNGIGSLQVMSAVGGDPEVLLADKYDHSFPAWRPDNRRLLFRSNRGGGALDLWELDTDTGATTQLTSGIYDLMTFSVSADNRIVFTPFWHDTFLHIVDVDSGEKHQVTSHTKDNFGARFSPDGGTISYHSTRTGNSEIWLHYLDGRPETQLTDAPGWDLYADWSPDGSKLIFVSDREEGRFKIFIANSDGGGKRLLVDQPINVAITWAPVNAELVSRWSPDGSRIAYLVTGEESNALWTVQPDGEDARELLTNVVGFDWYRDNRHAIYTRLNGSETEMVAVDLETGQERSLYIGPIMEMDVAPDGSAVAFCFGRGHMVMGLAVLKLEPPVEPGGLPGVIGEPEFVVRAEGGWHVHNGGWSSDSKSLVYTQDTDYGDIFELVERR
jgi:serine/threonine protein kinase